MFALLILSWLGIGVIVYAFFIDITAGLLLVGSLLIGFAVLALNRPSHYR